MSTVRAGRRLLGIALRGDGARVAAGLALLVGSTAAALAQPWPLKLVVDSVLGPEAPPAILATASRPTLLAALVAAMIGLQVVVGALAMLGTNIVIRAALRTGVPAPLRRLRAPAEALAGLPRRHSRRATRSTG